jgi:hypothetical protein
MGPPRRLNAAVSVCLCDLSPVPWGPGYSPWARAMISLEIDSGTSLYA